MRVYKYGTKILRKVAKRVNEDFPVDDYSYSMFDTLRKTGGVGLACPQIGESKRMFVINVDGVDEVFVNPQIEYLGEKVYMDEGCLSIPGIEAGVLRYEKVTVTYTNRHWEQKTQTFSGLVARVIQHEYDHLDGVLFIDHLPKEELKEFGTKLDKLSMKKEDVSSPRFSTGGGYGNGGSRRGMSFYSNTVTATAEIPLDDIEVGDQNEARTNL